MAEEARPSTVRGMNVATRRSGASVEILQRLAYTFGRRNRQRKFEFVRRVIENIDAREILLIGVHPDTGGAGIANLVERQIEDLPGRRVVASGIDPAREETAWSDYRHADVLDLPFDDDSFDLVYANAVIEHVGLRPHQQQMVAEMARVGDAWIITTPNRFFPVEAHFHTLFTHWRSGWSRGAVTRLLSRRDLQELVGAEATVIGHPVSPTLTAIGGTRTRAERPDLGVKPPGRRPSRAASRGPRGSRSPGPR
jgi:hypothetical protein